ncbi:FUN14 domain-containing protein [Nitrospinae bacterium AH_259_B05_G02_I21]|jgi:uncharacterized protein YqfA (UPF0365 family)|nr:FUN14 domain-containing protein [Nitrospinae bacterium AH_259_B05_G02_I21]
MATDWLSALSPHWQPALVGAAIGFATGLILRRVVKSILVTVGFALAVYLVIASTTDWLKGVDLASAGHHAVAYAKAHRAGMVVAVRRFASIHLAGSAGFVVGLAGGLALTRRRRPSTPQTT